MPVLKINNATVSKNQGPKIDHYFRTKIDKQKIVEEPEIIWLPTPDKENERAPLSDDSWMSQTPPNQRLPLGPITNWVETPTCPWSPFSFMNVARNLFAELGDEEPLINNKEGEDKKSVVCKPHIPASPSCEPDASWDLTDVEALLDNLGEICASFPQQQQILNETTIQE